MATIYGPVHACETHAVQFIKEYLYEYYRQTESRAPVGDFGYFLGLDRNREGVAARISPLPKVPKAVLDLYSA
jgi:hypothetical protein